VFKHRPIKDFVLKKAVTKPTIPHEPNLRTKERKEIRDEYEKRAKEYRRDYIKKKREEIERRQKDKTSHFNLHF
jgi:hypothetical protein